MERRGHRLAAARHEAAVDHPLEAVRNADRRRRRGRQCGERDGELPGIGEHALHHEAKVAETTIAGNGRFGHRRSA